MQVKITIFQTSDYGLNVVFTIAQSTSKAKSYVSSHLTDYRADFMAKTFYMLMIRGIIGGGHVDMRRNPFWRNGHQQIDLSVDVVQFAGEKNQAKERNSLEVEKFLTWWWNRSKKSLLTIDIDRQIIDLVVPTHRLRSEVACPLNDACFRKYDWWAETFPWSTRGGRKLRSILRNSTVWARRSDAKFERLATFEKLFYHFYTAIRNSENDTDDTGGGHFARQKRWARFFLLLSSLLFHIGCIFFVSLPPPCKVGENGEDSISHSSHFRCIW